MLCAINGNFVYILILLIWSSYVWLIKTWYAQLSEYIGLPWACIGILVCLQICHLTFFRSLYANFSLVVVHPPLFESILEPVLDNLGELSVSCSTDRLTWDIPVPGDPSQTVSMSTTKLAWVEVLVLIDFKVKQCRPWWNYQVKLMGASCQTQNDSILFVFDYHST